MYEDYTAKNYFIEHPTHYDREFEQDLELDEYGKIPNVLIFYRLLLHGNILDSAAYVSIQQALNMNKYFNKKAIAVDTYLQRYDCPCIDCVMDPHPKIKKPINRFKNSHIAGNVQRIKRDVISN